MRAIRKVKNSSRFFNYKERRIYEYYTDKQHR